MSTVVALILFNVDRVYIYMCVYVCCRWRHATIPKHFLHLPETRRVSPNSCSINWWQRLVSDVLLLLLLLSLLLLFVC